MTMSLPSRFIASFFVICLMIFLFYPLFTHTDQLLVVIKPDVVKENHIGDVIARFEKNDLFVAGLKLLLLNKDQAQTFFSLQNKNYDPALLDYMSSGPVVVMVLQGYQAMERAQELIGAEDPLQAKPGTIRADFGETLIRNAVYATKNPQSADNEITYFFSPDEIQNRTRSL